MILSGRCYLSGKLVERDIEIDDGKIIRVERSIFGRKNIVSDGIILPGGIDIHVHFREPGMTEKEDFYTGSLAALHGGITTIFDMPNTRPVTLTHEDLLEKASLAGSKSLVDFGLYAFLKDLRIAKGVKEVSAGFKAYLTPSTGGLETPKEILVEYVADPDLNTRPVHTHAEGITIGETRARTLEEHDTLRPGGGEVSSVKWLAEIAPEKVHLCHLSTPESVQVCIERKVSFEVAPRHMLLDYSMKHIQKTGKVNPPLRSPGVRERLFTMFKDGKIPILASDHAPHTLPEKEGTFQESPAGMPEVEWWLPIMLAYVKNGVLELKTVVEASSINPGRLMKIPKGEIKKGYDADLLIVRMNDLLDVEKERIFTKCGWTPYHGFKGVFPRKVMLRGEVIFDGSQPLETRGFGRFIRTPL